MKKPKIEVVENNSNVFKAVLKNVPVEIANSLRRIIMSEVRTIAIDDVFVFKNNSVLNDDTLAHRLGLIPLKASRQKIMKLISDVNEADYVTLVLKVSAKDKPITVYSGDLKSKDRLVKPLSDKIEIAKLAPGQQIEAELWARVGSGSEHAKWSPVSVAVVRGIPKIKLKGDIPKNVSKKLVDLCPKDVFIIDKGVVKVSDPLKCTLCMLCEKEYPKYVKVDIDESSSLLYFESIGQLSNKEIVEDAFEILLDKLNGFIKSFNEVEVNVT